MKNKNLIERVGGIEWARAIVDGAPDGEVYCHFYDPEFHYFAKTSEYFDETAMIFDGGGWEGCDDGYPHNGRLDHAPYILISDLRTAIAQYDSKPCQHGYDVACLICGFGTVNGERVWHRKFESDDCTDIRNHISPNTKVVEL